VLNIKFCFSVVLFCLLFDFYLYDVVVGLFGGNFSRGVKLLKNLSVLIPGAFVISLIMSVLCRVMLRRFGADFGEKFEKSTIKWFVFKEII